ncbi:MAG: PilZ domain-containing protein [Bdellovibrionales bacterium]
MDQIAKKEPGQDPRMIIRRRRVPRRDFFNRIGLLVRGAYHVSRAVQIGEGGMMINSKTPLAMGQKVVVSFKLPGLPPDVVLACVRYVLPAENGQADRYGVEFLNLDFNIKREVRNYVAQTGRNSSTQ